jgi:hypothetical protein
MTGSSPGGLDGRGRQMTGSSSAGFDRAARAGLAAKGVLYAVLGVLAAQLAVGDLSGGADQQGAMRQIALQPFGGVLLVVLAVGLAGYALWRCWQAIDPPASSLPRWLLRAAMLVRALLYAGFALLAGFEVADAAREGADEQSLTAMVLGVPGGTLAVAAVGIVIVVVGLVQFREAWTAGFLDDLDVGRTEPRGRAIEWLGRSGHAARGVVFGVSGWFVVRAAVRAEPEEGVGLDAALQQVAGAPAGSVVLGAVAVGLVLYGTFCLVQARFARPAEVE